MPPAATSSPAARSPPSKGRKTIPRTAGVWAAAGVGVIVAAIVLAVLARGDSAAAPLLGLLAGVLVTVYAALLVLQLVRRRTFAAGVAATVGSFAFLTGASVLFALGAVSGRPAERLADLNEILGVGVVLLLFGTVLTVQAATALGNTASHPFGGHRRWLALLLPVAPAIALGQWLVNEPGRAPWLFPFINLAVVVLPSLAFAAIVTPRYRRANRWSLPVTRREWFSAIAYGAIGATTVAGLINSLYFLSIAEWLVRLHDIEGPFSAAWRTRLLPQGAAVFADLSPVAIVAPISEELWKGLIVAVFAYRRGSAARAFLWGALAGAGFNILETFSNSIASVQPNVLADPDLRGEWWLFGLARVGTGLMHSAATALAALGIYGVLRGRWHYLLAYQCGVLMHAAWNIAVYLVVGDQFEAASGPDAPWLDFTGVALMAGIAALAASILWFGSGRLRDEQPLPLYQALGMLPSPDAERAPPPARPVLPRLGRFAPLHAAPAAAAPTPTPPEWTPERWD